MGSTLVEKIAKLYSDRAREDAPVRAGDELEVRPRHLVVVEAAGRLFATGGAPPRIHEPRQPVVGIARTGDGAGADASADPAAEGDAGVVARELGVACVRASDPWRGILDEGYVIPGSMCVATESEGLALGAVSALVPLVSREEAARVLATGRFVWRVPEAFRIDVAPADGSRADGSRVDPSRVEGALRRLLDEEGPSIAGRAVEVAGAGAGALSIDARGALAASTVASGAAAVLFPADRVVLEFFRERARVFTERGDVPRKITEKLVAKFERTRLDADDDATYATRRELDPAGP